MSANRSALPILDHLLRALVIVAAGLVFAGGIFYISRNGIAHPRYAVFAGEPRDLRTVHGVLRGTFSLDPSHVIQLGILLLITTPVIRVAFLLAGFAIERDRIYVVLSGIVLCILLYSLTGKHGTG